MASADCVVRRQLTAAVRAHPITHVGPTSAASLAIDHPVTDWRCSGLPGNSFSITFHFHRHDRRRSHLRLFTAHREVAMYKRGHFVLRFVTLFSKVDLNKLRLNVKNEMAFICAKYGADVFNISQFSSCKTTWPPLFCPTRCN